MSKIKDIYDGKEITIWKDEEFVYFSLGMTTIGIPEEIWETVKEDLQEFVKTIK